MEPEETKIYKEYKTYTSDSVMAMAMGMQSQKSITEFDDMIKQIRELGITDDGDRHSLHPNQKKFLEILKENESGKYELSDQDNICILHCLKYEHYSDIHRDTLNKLIKKYAK